MIRRNNGERKPWGVSAFHWWIQTDITDPIQKQRGQLLNLFLLAGLLYSTGFFIKNLFELSNPPTPQQVAFLFMDVFAILGNILLWCFSRAGYVRWASLAFLICTCLLIAVGFPPHLIDRAASLYTIPIVISSFVLAPASSLILALLAIAGYSLVYAHNFASNNTLPYNYITIPALLALAIASWAIAARLERALKVVGEARAELETLVAQIVAVIYIDAIDEWSSAIYLSPHVVKLLGYSPEEWYANPKLWLELLHPDDHDRVLAEHLRTNRTGAPFSVEYRMITRDGRIVWVHDDAVLRHDEQGRPQYWQGVLYDITNSKLTEQALAYERDLLQALMNNTPDTIYIKDTAGQFIRINRAQAETLGVKDPSQAIGKTDFDFFSQEHALAAQADEQRIMTTHQPMVDKIEELSWPDGHRRWVSATKAPLLDQEGRCQGIVGISRDIHDRKKMEDRLKYMSIHDALTGLYNRAFFDEELARLARTTNIPISVILADVDGLKQVNDSYGHNGGDKILQRAADVLRAGFRSEDIVARIGGDEFAILLPGVQADKIPEILQRLQQLTSQNNSPAEPLLGLSLGASTAETGQALSLALKIADEQMYRAKPARLERKTTPLSRE